MALFKQQENLKNDNTRIEALNDIKQCLTSARGNDIAEYANSIQLPLVFACLENAEENEEQIDLACDIITICMENLSLGESVLRYCESLEKSLIHKNDIVRQMSLKEILRTAERDVNYFNDRARKDLILKIVDCVGHDNISVAHVAVNILCHILLPWLSNIHIQSGLKNVMARGEVHRFRIYEIITHLASKSKENFNKIEATNLLSKMLSELDTQDELVQLNVLELLTQLALCDHGFSYLASKGVFMHLATQIENIDKSPLSHLVLPGLLKFFGRVAHAKPIDMLNEYKKVVLKIFDAVLNCYDETLLLVAIDTVGYLGATRDGKVALNSMGDSMSAIMKKLGVYIQNGTTEVKIRALDCLNHLVSVDGSDSTNEIETISQKWFNMICDNTIEVIFNICRKPFPDVKLGALNILKSIAAQLWGADLILNNPGILEYLLDRRTENFKEGKHVKYDIIFALNQVPNLDMEISQRLHLYVTEGPYYVEAITDIAIEGE